MDYELKPCPFCGGEARLSRAGAKHIIFCPNCVRLPADGGYIRQEDAITAWNNRPDNWISVEDRLPEIIHDDFTPVNSLSLKVIVTAKNKISGKTAVTTDQIINGDWADHPKDSRFWQVTHWMPLPEPPKGAESE